MPVEVKVTRASSTLLAVRFAYDEEVIAAVKQIPGRTWNKPNHVWVIPASPENVATLRSLMPRHVRLLVETKLLAELEAQKAALAKGQAARDAGDSAIAFDYVTTPYAHQRAGLEFLVHLGSAALLWEMGLGKTKTAIDYAEWLCDNALVQHELEHGCGEVRGTRNAGTSSLRSGLAPPQSRAGQGDTGSLPGSQSRTDQGDHQASLREGAEVQAARRDGGSGRGGAGETGRQVRNLPGTLHETTEDRPQPQDGPFSGASVRSVQPGVGPDERRRRTAPCGWRVPIRILTVTPNTVKRNWGAEIEKHAGHDAYIIPDGTLPKRAAQFGRARYTIVNAEALSYQVTAEALKAIVWDLVIVDESTRFKTPSARRTKVLHKLRATHRVILTGTPITGKPEDAWSQLEFVSPGLFGSFWSFRDRYLQLDYFRRPVGVKPAMAQDLVDRIAQRSYRILKRDVLDLPEKVYADRVVELAGNQAKAYRQMREELRVEIEGSPRFTAANILTVLLRLTQITAGLIGTSDTGYAWLPDGAKLVELDNLLLDELRGEQVVIFGQYQRELEELADRYSTEKDRATVRFESASVGNKGLPIIYGPTPEKVRHVLVDEFQAGKRRLLFCQNRTGGIGINLTAAQTVVFYTGSWSYEDRLQAQDRLHRIGQTGTVAVLTMIAKGTIDEEIEKALKSKANVADYLTGDGARELARRILG